MNKKEICEAAAEYLLKEVKRGPIMDSPKEVRKYLRLKFMDLKNETFGCLFLDTRHRVIAFEILFHGTVDGAAVYPRVIAQRCLEVNAAAVILAHNHPSGITEPSLADQAITRRVKDALALLDIRLLDHFVVGDNEPISMAEKGQV